MAVLEGLTINLGANIVGFSKGMKKAGARVSQFAKKIAGIGKRIAAFGAAATAIAAGALTVMVKRQFDVIDSLGKMSGSIGIATDKLVALRMAGQLGGVSAEQMDKSLIRMTKSIADASNGLSTSTRAFEALGLNIQALQAMTPDQQFKAIADAMASVENTTLRAGVAMDIFGKQGVSLLNVLQGGTAAIEAMEKETQKMGLAISNVDSAKIELANDSVSKLKKLFSGLARQIAIRVAPIVKFLADKLFAVGTAGKGMAGIVQKAFGFLENVMATMVTVGDVVLGVWQQLQAGIAKVIAFIIKGIGGMMNFAIKAFEFLGAKVPQVFKEMSRGVKEFGDILDQQADAVLKIGFDKVFDAFSGDTAGKKFLKSLDKIKAETDAAAQKVVSDRIEFNTPKIIDKLAEITAKVESKITNSISKIPEMAATAKAKVTIAKPGAFERGSAAAFSAARSIENRQEQVQKKQLRALERIEQAIQRQSGGLELANIA